MKLGLLWLAVFMHSAIYLPLMVQSLPSAAAVRI
jgi:hypothetical protein